MRKMCGGDHFVVIREVVSFSAALLRAPSDNATQEQGAAALSSPAHLLTYTFSRRRAVYFHINKAHPFKFCGGGSEFNLEAVLSVISSYYLWWWWWGQKKIQLSQLQPAHYFCYI